MSIPKFLSVSVLALVVGVAVGFIFFGERPLSVADDANHVTSLGIGSHVVQHGQGPVPAVIATMTTQSATDAMSDVTLFTTDPGSATEFPFFGGVSQLPGTPPSTVVLAWDRTQFATGTLIRAQFLTKDAGGNTTFSYSRTLTAP